MLEQAKSTLLSAYERMDRVLPANEVEHRREIFLSRYSPDILLGSSGDDMMRLVYGDEPKSCLFYDLEYGEAFTPFGSVGGGSALKFKVYKAGDGSGYKKKGPGNVPIPCPDVEAERMTADMMASLGRALQAVEDYDLPAGDPERWRDFEARVGSDLPPSLAQIGHDSPVALLGWGHKYLAICRPDVFSFHHQPHQLASHLVRLGEVPAEQKSRYLLDRQWMTLRRDVWDVSLCHPALLMKAAYAAFGNETRYWRIGTDEENVDRWPPMRDGAFASIGWAFLGNLRELLTGLEGTAARDRIKQVFAATDWFREKSPQLIGKWATQLHAFYAGMVPGDRIIAMKGETLLGVGEVLGEYEYVANDLQPHHRAVRWHHITHEVWKDPPGIRTTVYEFFEKRIADAVRVESLLLSSDPLPMPEPVIDSETDDSSGDAEETELTEAVPLTALEQRINDVLERKGQIILYGPPGTGKTYHARQAARELVAREVCGGRAWAMLSEDQRAEVDKSIEFVTFHPAYAYEDFIEGYRPKTSDTGAPTFELRAGLFIEFCEQARKTPDRHQILLIDEINRGNVAAVMGELITLLESDKRDSVAAVLPLSRRAFRVPKNVWIIGTMNTADRSISLLDAALRRRFGFVELLPEPERVAVTIDGLSLSALLTEINARIRRYVTRNARELQVGHAYLMHAGEALRTKEALLAAFRDDILPLLAEYCFENYATLARIVGDEIIDVAGQLPAEAVLSSASGLHQALLRLVSADPARITNLGDSDDSGEDAEEETGGLDDTLPNANGMADDA